MKRGVNISCLPDEGFPHVVQKHCKYSRIDRAGRKSLEVGRENLQADYPNSLQPGAKEAKATLSIFLKASLLHKEEKLSSLETNDTHISASQSSNISLVSKEVQMRDYG